MKLKSLKTQQTAVRRLYKTWRHCIRHGDSQAARRTLGDTWLQVDAGSWPAECGNGRPHLRTGRKHSGAFTRHGRHVKVMATAIKSSFSQNIICFFLVFISIFFDFIWFTYEQFYLSSVAIKSRRRLASLRFDFVLASDFITDCRGNRWQIQLLA